MVGGTLAEDINVVPQFRRKVELLLRICNIISQPVLQTPFKGLMLAQKESINLLPRFGSPSLATNASMFFSILLYDVRSRTQDGAENYGELSSALGA